MRELVRGSKLFEKRLPELEPVFINLSTTGQEELQRKTGMLGWVLWMNQQQKQKSDIFGDVLTQVIHRVNRLHAQARGRWEHLLWFAQALVYHTREGDERRQMAEFIRETVRNSEQAEVENMGKTIAEVIKEEGFLEGALNSKRETLVQQLRLRFKRVPTAIEEEINATRDVKQLDDWLADFATAKTLSDIPFSSRS